MSHSSMMEEKFKFQDGSKVIVFGASNVGKTVFCEYLIKEKNILFITPPNRVHFVYKYAQGWFEKYPQVEFVKSIPENISPHTHDLMIIDDCIEADMLKDVASFFQRGCHHLRVTAIFITQNLYLQNNDYRTIALNADTMVLFASVRGMHQVKNIARQIFDGKADDFTKLYKEVTNVKYNYLIVDLRPGIKERIRGNLFSHDGPQSIYRI